MKASKTFISKVFRDYNIFSAYLKLVFNDKNTDIWWHQSRH